MIVVSTRGDIISFFRVSPCVKYTLKMTTFFKVSFAFLGSQTPRVPDPFEQLGKKN